MAIKKYKGQYGLEIEQTEAGVSLSINGDFVGCVNGTTKISVGDYTDPAKSYLIVNNNAAFPLVESVEDIEEK